MTNQDVLLERIEALDDAAQRVPLGHECRSCGASTYNHLRRFSRYLATGDPCCAHMRIWLDPSTPKAMSAAERAKAEAPAPLPLNEEP